MAEFAYEDLLPIGPDRTDYRPVTTEGVPTVEGPGGHLAQLRRILDDPEASDNATFVPLGPTTAGRMDSSVEPFQAAHGGFCPGSIGGPAARPAQDCTIKVDHFPACIVVDDEGHDFFASVTTPLASTIPVRAGA